MLATNITCRSCDEPVEQNAKFCPFCGVENPVDSTLVVVVAEQQSVSSETTSQDPQVAESEAQTPGRRPIEHRPPLSRPEIESLVFASVLAAAAGGLLFGWIGAVLFAFVAGSLLRWNQRKENPMQIPEALRQSVWLPISIFEAIANVIESVTEKRRDNKTSTLGALRPEASPPPADGRVPQLASANSRSNGAILNNRLRGAPFALAALCFLLPFAKFSCTISPDVSYTVSGIHLVTGTEIESSDFGGFNDYGASDAQEVSANPLAIIALLCCLAGLALFFSQSRPVSLIAVISGAIGFLAMLALKFQLDYEIAEQGEGMFVVEYLVGFIAVCIFLLAGAAINVYFLRQGQQRTSDHSAAV